MKKIRTPAEKFTGFHYKYNPHKIYFVGIIICFKDEGIKNPSN